MGTEEQLKDLQMRVEAFEIRLNQSTDDIRRLLGQVRRLTKQVTPWLNSKAIFNLDKYRT